MYQFWANSRHPFRLFAFFGLTKGGDK